MRTPNPPFNDTDAVDYPDLPAFIPDSGDPQTTAKVLTDAADKQGLPQSHIRSDASRGGFWISDALADVVYDDDDDAEEAPEEVPEEAPKKATTKSPAKATAKTGSTKKKGTRS